MDPLAQYVCPLHSVHTEEDCPPKQHMCKHYQPQPIDEEVYHDVQEEYKRWGRGKSWFLDFISEEATITKSTWDNLVQRQEQIQPEKETFEREHLGCFVTQRVAEKP
jgi:hypothetical protein